MEGDTYPTIHLVYVYIHNSKKIISIESDDLEFVKNFKEKLTSYLDNLVLTNLTIFHKIAHFLFPPLNQLIQFSEEEKLIIKDECKQ